MRDQRGRLPAPGLRNELVDWFNAVDTTYRADLRELNELNVTRFDAKMGARLAEFEVELERRFAEFDVKLEQRLARLETDWTARWSTLDAKIDRRLAETKSELVKWMFAFWAASTFTTLGAAVGIVTLLLRR